MYHKFINILFFLYYLFCKIKNFYYKIKFVVKKEQLKKYL